MKVILAGDIGGTKTRLALFRPEGGRPHLVDEQTFPSPQFPDLDSIVAQFLSSRDLLAARVSPAARGGRVARGGRRASGMHVARACFGVAGPVVDGRSATTNLPWVVDAPRLARRDLAALNAGVRGASGNAAIIAAGTGLGEAGPYWDGRRHHPFACEGGHASFAPADELQAQLLAHLRRAQEHVSWERVLSGPGLTNIYGFLRDTGRGEEPPWLAGEMRRDERMPVRVILNDRTALLGAARRALLGVEDETAATGVGRSRTGSRRRIRRTRKPQETVRDE